MSVLLSNAPGDRSGNLNVEIGKARIHLGFVLGVSLELFVQPLLPVLAEMNTVLKTTLSTIPNSSQMTHQTSTSCNTQHVHGHQGDAEHASTLFMAQMVVRLLLALHRETPHVGGHGAAG